MREAARRRCFHAALGKTGEIRMARHISAGPFSVLFSYEERDELLARLLRENRKHVVRGLASVGELDGCGITPVRVGRFSRCEKIGCRECAILRACGLFALDDFGGNGREGNGRDDIPVFILFGRDEIDSVNLHAGEAWTRNSGL